MDSPSEQLAAPLVFGIYNHVTLFEDQQVLGKMESIKWGIHIFDNRLINQRSTALISKDGGRGELERLQKLIPRRSS